LSLTDARLTNTKTYRFFGRLAVSVPASVGQIWAYGGDTGYNNSTVAI
jgi:hypothetical protein